MDTPDREAKSLAHYFKQRVDPVHGEQSQVTVIAKDKEGTEHPTGWAASIAAAFAKADAYIAKHIPGYTL